MLKGGLRVCGGRLAAIARAADRPTHARIRTASPCLIVAGIAGAADAGAKDRENHKIFFESLPKADNGRLQGSAENNEVETVNVCTDDAAAGKATPFDPERVDRSVEECADGFGDDLRAGRSG